MQMALSLDERMVAWWVVELVMSKAAGLADLKAYHWVRQLGTQLAERMVRLKGVMKASPMVEQLD